MFVNKPLLEKNYLENKEKGTTGVLKSIDFGEILFVPYFAINFGVTLHQSLFL